MRQRRNRRSIGTIDSDERGPTAGVAGSGLSGIAGRGASAAGVKMAGSTAEQILRVFQE